VKIHPPKLVLRIRKATKVEMVSSSSVSANFQATVDEFSSTMYRYRGGVSNPSTASPTIESSASASVSAARVSFSQQAKKIFKKLCRQYMRTRLPPSYLLPLWDLRDYIDFEDFVMWKSEVGLKKGAIWEEDGRIYFDQWPIKPHEQIIGDFNSQFSSQFVSIFIGTAHWNAWIYDGTTGIALYQNQFNFSDIRIPGRRKQPDAAWRPRPRRQDPNSAQFIPLQSNGELFPTLALEVGSSQLVADLQRIRDRMLGWKSGVNVVVLIAYNRNQTRNADSWYLEVSERDYTAPSPPPNTPVIYPPCHVIFSTPKQGSRFPLVNTPLPANLHTFSIPTTSLYNPEPVPATNPQLPPNFILQVEQIRMTIMNERMP
jgi:hypothetical protein